MEIYLIRHGHCFNSTMQYFNYEKKTMDPPLTDKGVKQAHELAERLRTVYFDKIYSSDLIRAQHTAEIVQSAVKTDLIISEAFREINMGLIHEKPWSEFPEIFEKWKLHKEDIAYPNGENGQDVWNRCSKEIDALINKNYERVAIISHGGAIRAMMCGLLNIPQQVRFQFGYPIENCSISVFRYLDGRFYLHSLNDVSYISEI